MILNLSLTKSMACYSFMSEMQHVREDFKGIKSTNAWVSVEVKAVS